MTLRPLFFLLLAVCAVAFTTAWVADRRYWWRTYDAAEAVLHAAVVLLSLTAAGLAVQAVAVR